MPNLDEIRELIERLVAPGSFFIAPQGRLRTVYLPRDELAWEIFHGHLLDAARTRECRVFETWQVRFRGPGEPAEQGDAPIICIHLDAPASLIFVTRHIRHLGWEAYEDPPGVIQSRQAPRWLPELVASLDFKRQGSPARLNDKLARSILLAVIGTSRLPVASLESPLPAFALGHLAWLLAESITSEPSRDPLALVAAAMQPWPDWVHRAKTLEAALRAVRHADVGRLAQVLEESWRQSGSDGPGLIRLCRTLFNHLALARHDEFFKNLASLVRRMASPAWLGPAAASDLFSYMLRHLARHMTAYDLVRFHSQGANYPDAILLDELLRAWLDLVDEHENLFQGHELPARIRRRALRQACMLRRQYEGHLVPDAPTSPGENARILPRSYAPVPEEQLHDPSVRRKRLYADVSTDELLSPAARTIWAASLLDFHSPGELRELGMGVYLDRPLGCFKQPGDVDRTWLASYEAFSRKVARQRLMDICAHASTSDVDRESLERRLANLPIGGFSVSNLAEPAWPPAPRPGVVALEDALLAAADFVFVRSTRTAINELLDQYEFGALAELAPDVLRWLAQAGDVLLIRTVPCRAARPGEPLLVAFDGKMRARIRFAAVESRVGVAYLESAGTEYLARGLRVISYLESTPDDWRECEPVELILPPRL